MRFDTALILFVSIVTAQEEDRYLRQRLLGTTRVASLQEVIIRDMMPASSSFCARQPIASTFTFESSQSVSQWDEKFVGFEELVFQAKVAHTDTNSNRTWTMRLGKAGNIYSLVGAMGETVPPQKRADSPWVDEVWQAVTVGASFIHEAGIYQRDADFTAIPFFSPSLGKYCDDASGECGFVSWGQQAHVPTDLKSDILYLNRYVNCGDGVIEHVTLRHNNLGGDSGQTFDYINAPWGGTRNTVLKDVVLTNAGSNSLELIDPLPDWSAATTILLRDTMGFTVFAEDLPKAGNPLHNTPYPLPQGVTLKIATRGCLDNTIERYKCFLESTTPSVLPQGGTVTLTGSGGSFVASVRHWSYNGNGLFIYKNPNISLDIVRNALRPGDTVQVFYYLPPKGKAPEDNLALGHVHGALSSTNPNYPRVRYGRSARDFNVYTVNARPTIAQGDTYFYRQYFMLDTYTEMAAKGAAWATEAFDEVYHAGSKAGRTISLYSDGAMNFGYALGDGDCSAAGSVTLVCQGSTTPQPDSRALFQVQCGNEVVVTFDPYHFTPPGTPVRSYLCDGKPMGIRPQWTLLGFFNENCQDIASNFELDEQLCGENIITL